MRRFTAAILFLLAACGAQAQQISGNQIKAASIPPAKITSVLAWLNYLGLASTQSPTFAGLTVTGGITGDLVRGATEISSNGSVWSVAGPVTMDDTLNVSGTISGHLAGTMTGNVTGNASTATVAAGLVNGATEMSSNGSAWSVAGPVAMDDTLNVSGTISGHLAGTVTGNVTGNVTGSASSAGSLIDALHTFGWSELDSAWATSGGLKAPTFTGDVTGNLTGTASGNLTAASALDASKLSGTVADGRLSSNVPLKNAVNDFTNSMSLRQATQNAEPLRIYSHADVTPTGDGGPMIMGMNAAGSDESWRLWHKGFICVDEDGSDQVDIFRDLTSAYISIRRTNATDTILYGRIVGDTVLPFQLSAYGTATYGPGGAGATDVTWGRTAVGEMGSSASIRATTTIKGDATSGHRLGVDTGKTPAFSVIGSNTGVIVSDTVADNTNKVMRLTNLNYLAAEEPVAVIASTATSGANNLYIGGGSSVTNAATLIQFYTAGNTTTTTGTERMRITYQGLVGIGTNNPSALTHIVGTAPASVAGNGTAATPAMTVTGSAGGATSGTTGQNGGTGASISLAAGAGGTAPSGSVNGAGGNITLTPGAAGAGAGTAGTAGKIVLAGPVQITGGTPGAGKALISDADGDAVWTEQTATLQAALDGGGGAIPAGNKCRLEVPYNCTITSWTVLADVSGSIAVDVYKQAYSAYSTSAWGSAICSPAISGAIKAQTTGLSISLTAGDILTFNMAGAATDITNATVSLKVTKS